MKPYDIIRRSLRSLLSAKARTLLTAFAIAVGAFALTLTLAASNGANNYADTIVKDNFNPSELIVSASDELFGATDASTPKEYNPNISSFLSPTGDAAQIETLDDNDIVRLRSIDGVTSVRTASTVSLQYITRDGYRKYAATAQSYSAYKSPDLVAGVIGANITDNQIVLPEGFLQTLGFESAQAAIGKQVRIAVRQQADQTSIVSSVLNGDTNAAQSALIMQPETVERVFTVIAVNKKPPVLIQPGAELYVTMSEKSVQALSDEATKDTASYHKYVTAYVTVKDGTDSNKLTTVQAKIKQQGYGAQSVVDTQETITQVLSVLQGIVLLFGLIAVVASVFGVVNTMYISVLQRTREIGLMKALGMHRRTITQLFLFEAGLIGLLGGLIGVVTAFVLGTVLNPTIAAQLNLGDARILDFHSDQLFVLILVLALVAMLAGYLPARSAARLDPIEALRSE